jgi:hypothetical protein
MSAFTRHIGQAASSALAMKGWCDSRRSAGARRDRSRLESATPESPSTARAVSDEQLRLPRRPDGPTARRARRDPLIPAMAGSNKTPAQAVHPWLTLLFPGLRQV